MSHLPRKREEAARQVPRELVSPMDFELLLRKRKALKRELLQQSNLLAVKLAILGGSTTSEIRSMLELFLLGHGIQPQFYESDYNAFFEDIAFANPELNNFKPDIVFIHTTWHNVSRFPGALEPESAVDSLLRELTDRFESIWQTISARFGALIIQNNFDLPRLRSLGNLDGSAQFGRIRTLQRLNEHFSRYAETHSRFLINDIHYLCAQVGLKEWFDYSYWYSYRMAVTPIAAAAIAQNVASIIKSTYGRAKKCLVLDLDNTLWGGEIGEAGVQGIVIGRDDASGEAFLAFQRYVKDLRDRGVLLGVCSKNDLRSAMEGFSHPDTILKLEDFSAFRANWSPKPENIREISTSLNIGLEHIVFVDDNPAERAIVSAQLPEVAVPEVGSDVSSFPEILNNAGYFEPVSIVAEDFQRSDYYSVNVQRDAEQHTHKSYDDFLDSLEMKAESGPFSPLYLDRITQLINKTNQFNLTTKRCTRADVDIMAADASYIALYGRLEDKFGDNGLVSVIVAVRDGGCAWIDIWLMSCRVLKRDMEYFMFDALVEECIARGIHTIKGAYIPSPKNAMVAELLPSVGFASERVEPDGRTFWSYLIPAAYARRSRFIRNSQEAVLASRLAAQTVNSPDHEAV